MQKGQSFLITKRIRKRIIHLRGKIKTTISFIRYNVIRGYVRNFYFIFIADFRNYASDDMINTIHFCVVMTCLQME